MKYYTLKKILSKNCIYNLVIGERSNGKTYAGLEHIIKEYVRTGRQGAYVRRWVEDIRGYHISNLLSGIVENGVIKKATKGQYTGVKYYNRAFYFSYFDEEIGKDVASNEPFLYVFALTEMEHSKSTSYPKIHNILFDEFLTRQHYLRDEFVLFQNLISTIVRNKEEVKIFMFANTVNFSAPYFAEMGIKNIRKMEQGTIDIYKYGDSGLTLAIEYCGESGIKQTVNKYFAFDNPRLQMITGGAWEMDLYPHAPEGLKYLPVKKSIFFLFDDTILQGDLYKYQSVPILYIHHKTGDIKNSDDICIGNVDESPNKYHFNVFQRSDNPFIKRITNLFSQHNVYYQTNEVGEIMRNFLQTY